MAFIVTATEAAFAQHTFRDWVQTNELNIWRVRLAQLGKNSPYRNEYTSFLIDVCLVNLVCNDHQFMFVADFDNLLDRFVRKHLPGRVARVDNNHGAGADTVWFRDFDLLLQLLRISRPILLLFQVVRNELSLQQS